jgi:hypothetical protein
MPLSGRLFLIFLLPALATTGGCRHDRGQASPAPSSPTAGARVSAPTVLLSGSFERVAKPVSGRAEIRREGEGYFLVLYDVSIRAEGSVHVYLVGELAARTTRAVTEAALSYDMAELAQGNSEQRILLPSAPDPSLRSVVLFQADFGVNLAVAPLRPPLPGR